MVDKLFRSVELDLVPPRSICDMMTISYKGLESSTKGKVLWQIACLTLIWALLARKKC